MKIEIEIDHAAFDDNSNELRKLLDFAIDKAIEYNGKGWIWLTLIDSKGNARGRVTFKN